MTITKLTDTYWPGLLDKVEVVTLCRISNCWKGKFKI